MITNPDWLKAKIKPYFHQTKLSSAHVSLDGIEKLVECMENIDIEDMNCDNCLKMQKILSNEIEDEGFLGFAIENIDELFLFRLAVLRISNELKYGGG